MPKDYDVVTKTIVERYPRDWLGLLDLNLDRDLPVEVVDSNVSTVVAEADKVLRLGGASPGLVHIEVQKDYDPSMPVRLLRYNSLLRLRHSLPVLSAVVLLLPEGDGPAMSGRYADEWPVGRGRVELHFPVVRVWKESAAELASTLGTMPLAVLAARDGDEAERVLTPALAALGQPPTMAEREIATACYLFTGLRFDRGLAARIFKGTKAMRESVTYQAILEEGEAIGLEKGREKGRQEGREEGRQMGREEGREKGREEGRLEAERRVLLRQGSRRFGPPDDATRARVEAIKDPAALEAILDRVLDASSWEELLAGSA
ncbi:MAG: hypothetical protein U0835_25685 [Isosphaeraceae bacterium]